MTGRKFTLCLTSILGLFAAAAGGWFTGELGLYVSGICGAFVTGDTLITRSSLTNGKEREP